MAAAYELEKAGYKDVKILEMSQRYGGRVKTLDMKDGFDRGLYTDGNVNQCCTVHSCTLLHICGFFYHSNCFCISCSWCDAYSYNTSEEAVYSIYPVVK